MCGRRPDLLSMFENDLVSSRTNDEWCIRAKDFSHQYETNQTNQKAISKGWISVLMKESKVAGAVLLEFPFKTNLGGGCGWVTTGLGVSII